MYIYCQNNNTYLTSAGIIVVNEVCILDLTYPWLHETFYNN